MAFLRLGRDARAATSAEEAIVPGALSGSAARLRAVVTATERAVEQLEAAVDDQKRSTPRRSSDPGRAIETELVETLLSRARGLRDDADQLMHILERSLQTLGVDAEALRESSPHAEPPAFARRRTDPGGAERLRGAPVAEWRGPERRRLAADANMRHDATGNGTPAANESLPAANGEVTDSGGSQRRGTEN